MNFQCLKDRSPIRKSYFVRCLKFNIVTKLEGLMIKINDCESDIKALVIKAESIVVRVEAFDRILHDGVVIVGAHYLEPKYCVCKGKSVCKDRAYSSAKRIYGSLTFGIQNNWLAIHIQILDYFSNLIFFWRRCRFLTH